MIRNAGGIATEDATTVADCFPSSARYAGVHHHQPYGLRPAESEGIPTKAHLTDKMGTIASEPAHFYAFDDLEKNLRQQVQRVKSHPWIPKHIPVRGFIYDVKTGSLNEVQSDR